MYTTFRGLVATEVQTVRQLKSHRVHALREDAATIRKLDRRPGVYIGYANNDLGRVIVRVFSGPVVWVHLLDRRPTPEQQKVAFVFCVRPFFTSTADKVSPKRTVLLLQRAGAFFEQAARDGTVRFVTQFVFRCKSTAAAAAAPPPPSQAPTRPAPTRLIGCALESPLAPLCTRVNVPWF